MVENKCSKCGRQVEYTVTIRTDKGEKLYDMAFKEVEITNKDEYWCFDCVRAKILWPKPVTGTYDKIPWRRVD